MKYVKILFMIISVIVFVSCSDNPTIPPDNSELSKQSLLDEVNLLRTSPQAYVQILNSIKQYFNGYEYSEPGEVTIITHEGVAAVNEAINVLSKQKSLSALSLSSGLSNAAQAHSNDIGPKGLLSHNSSDGTDFLTRIEKYVKTNGYCAENISYGLNKSARSVVLQFVIDDGTPSRGHRTNLLEQNYRYIGFGWGYHSKYKQMCVFDFAQSVSE